MLPEAFAAARERLWRLADELAVGLPLADHEVLAIFAEFDSLLHTNCGSAAEGLFAGVAPICRLRPALVRPLLRRALLPLVYMGYERTEQVQEFVGWVLSQRSADLPLTEAGRQWLTEEFQPHARLVQQLLDELVREAEQDAAAGGG